MLCHFFKPIKILKSIFLYILVFSFYSPVYANENNTNISIDMHKAETYFSDIKEIVKKDNKNLWGISLYTPLLFVDTQTRDVIANEADNTKVLKKQKNTYIGKFPESQIISNSVTNLGGKDYAMVKWQSCDTDEISRNILLIHEMFHYNQNLLNLESPDGQPENKHLDEMNARIYLKLEWQALNKALNSDGEEKITAIKDAITFREHRRKQYNCYESENILEIHEGLPEYTGVVCSLDSKSDIENLMQKKLKNILNTDSFVRSFAYYSGPAYGILIDENNFDWRKNLTYNSDLGQILKNSYKIDIKLNSIEKAKMRYGYKKIYNEELVRKQNLDRKLQEYENKFIKNSIVSIELEEAHIGFNPNNLVPFKDIGTIYPNINITDSFGTLELKDGGCLLSNDWKKAVISADNIKIENSVIYGNEWTIQLNSDYTILKEDNNYIIKYNNSKIN